MSSTITLNYYYWSYGELCPFRINVPSDMVVDHCKTLILQERRIESRCCHLYKVPQDHPVLLNDLGALSSISDLGQLLLVFKSMQELFGLEPEQDRLHLVLVDEDIPLPVWFWIPSLDQLFLLNLEDMNTTRSLLETIRAKFPDLEKETLALYKTPFKNAQDLRDMTKGQKLVLVDSLFSLFADTPVTMHPCFTVEVVGQEQKHLLWDPVERATKKRTARGVSPSSMTSTIYHSVQGASEKRIFDYRRTVNYKGSFPDEDLPPIEVLFDGFGRFLDIWRSVNTRSFKPTSETLDAKVDKLVNAMSKVYQDESVRCGKGIQHLNSIFPSFGLRSNIRPSGFPVDSEMRTDGHSLYGPYYLPCILVEFKNENEGSKAMPTFKMLAYYDRLVKYIGKMKPDFVMGSRLPALGITILGPIITFFGLAYVGSAVCVPLTTSLWCLPVNCGGSDYCQLYTAFNAASVLLGRIEEEARRLTDCSPPRIEHPFYPQLNKLTGYHDPSSRSLSTGSSNSSQYIDIQITGFIAKDLHRHVYKASSSSGELVIKLTRSYSLELHAFCARKCYAPKLYAYQKLPGGFIAVAMAYMEGDPLESSSKTLIASAALCDKWTSGLQEIVKEMHDAGYVHGDLRPPNILRVRDGNRLMLLDFDWGGKMGEARYPHTRLHPQLKMGRDMTCLEITKADDERVLKGTLEYINERIAV